MISLSLTKSISNTIAQLTLHWYKLNQGIIIANNKLDQIMIILKVG